MLAIPGLADEKSSLRMASLGKAAEKTKALKIQKRSKSMRKYLGINTKLVTTMKNKFEEKPTENYTNDDIPTAIVCDDDEQPGGMVCVKGLADLDLVVTGPVNAYTELGHNQCVTGTGFGNEVGLAEECHTHSMLGTEVRHMQFELSHNQQHESISKQSMEKPLQKTKKVWKRGKNGLFSWRTEKIQMGKTTSSKPQNIQTSKSGSKPKPTVSSEKKISQINNWLLMAGGGRGGILCLRATPFGKSPIFTQSLIYTSDKKKRSLYIPWLICGGCLISAMMLKNRKSVNQTL